MSHSTLSYFELLQARKFTKSNCLCCYSCLQQSTIMNILSSVSLLIGYPPGMRTNERKHAAAQPDSSGFSSVSAFVSPAAASHQYLQRPRAECSDSGSEVGPVYLLRCQLQPNLMPLLLLRDRFCGRRHRHRRQLARDYWEMWLMHFLCEEKRQPQAVGSNSPLAFSCL